MNLTNMTMKQLHALRVDLDREVQEREGKLVQLSLQNLNMDLDHRIDASMVFLDVLKAAAKFGLALTTTSDRAMSVFEKKYAANGEDLSDVAKRIVDSLPKEPRS